MSQGFNSLDVSRFLDAGSVATAVGGAAVIVGTASNTVKVPAAVADKPVGVLQRTPDVGLDSTVDHVTIVVSGLASGIALSAINIGDTVVIGDVAGKLAPKSAAGYVVGEALTKAAAGEYFDLNVNIRKEPA